MRKAPALGTRRAAGDVDHEEDRLLVARCQAGDSAAFAELYLAYHDRLVRFCARRLRDSHEAEDAAHESFVKAWRSLDRFDGPGHFYPWLTVIAANVCTDTIRRRGRQDLMADLGALPDAAEPDGVADRLLTAEDAATASQALHRLNGRHRRVLHLREELGWSTHDIAAHEGLAPNAADTLLWRARAALQREYRALSEGVAGLVSLGGLRLLSLRRRLDALAHRFHGRTPAGLAALRGPAVWASSLVIAGGVLVATTAAPPSPGAHGGAPAGASSGLTGTSARTSSEVAPRRRGLPANLAAPSRVPTTAPVTNGPTTTDGPAGSSSPAGTGTAGTGTAAGGTAAMLPLPGSPGGRGGGESGVPGAVAGLSGAAGPGGAAGLGGAAGAAVQSVTGDVSGLGAAVGGAVQGVTNSLPAVPVLGSVVQSPPVQPVVGTVAGATGAVTGAVSSAPTTTAPTTTAPTTTPPTLPTLPGGLGSLLGP